MCFSLEIHHKWPPLIQFLLWFILMSILVFCQFSVWSVAKNHIKDKVHSTLHKKIQNDNVAKPLNYSTTNLDIFSNATSKVTPSQSGKQKYLEDEASIEHDHQWADFMRTRTCLLVFCCFGLLLFLIHIVVLFPWVVKHFLMTETEVILAKAKDRKYFGNIPKIHSLLLLLETVVFDIPVGLLTIELITCIWRNGVTASMLAEKEAIVVTKIVFKLSLTPLSLIAVYKGKTCPKYLISDIKYDKGLGCDGSQTICLPYGFSWFHCVSFSTRF